MRIGLIDADNIGKKSKFPNIALMKISSWYKSQGHHVEWYNLTEYYDQVFISKVFDFTPEPPHPFNAAIVHYGGVAYGIENKLPDYIEHVYPDYDLYSVKKAYGFLSRGCPRNCEFCNVTQHQGAKSHKVADLSEFWNGQKEIVLLDPNMFACKDWRDISHQLINSNAYIDFSQGIDVRLMTDKKIKMLNRMKLRRVHIAWDNWDYSNFISPTFEAIKNFVDKYRYSSSSVIVYVLVNFNTSFYQDTARIDELRDLGVEPYVMVYDKQKAPKHIKQLQRWVNNRPYWRSCESFEQYKQSIKLSSQNI